MLISYIKWDTLWKIKCKQSVFYSRKMDSAWSNGLISCLLCNFLIVLLAIRNWNAREMIHYNVRDISVTREMVLYMSINSRFSISMPKVDTFIRPVVHSGIAIDKSRVAKIPSHFLGMIFHREKFVAPGMRWTNALFCRAASSRQAGPRDFFVQIERRETDTLSPARLYVV